MIINSMLGGQSSGMSKVFLYDYSSGKEDFTIETNNTTVIITLPDGYMWEDVEFFMFSASDYRSWREAYARKNGDNIEHRGESIGWKEHGSVYPTSKVIDFPGGYLEPNKISAVFIMK